MTIVMLGMLGAFVLWTVRGGPHGIRRRNGVFAAQWHRVVGVALIVIVFASTAGLLDRAGLSAALDRLNGPGKTTQIVRSVLDENSPRVVKFVQPPRTDRKAMKRVGIIDGDTFVLGREKIRILNIDTPESFNARCEAELGLALEAKARLRSLLDRGPIELERDGKDRYGRTLARVSVDGIDVGAMLISEGHALPYRPGGEAKLARLQVWCGASAQLDDRWGGG